MAAAYFVQVDPECGQTLIADADALVVYAESSADALAICKAKFGGSSPAMWAGATATAIAAGADMEGWRLRIAILDASPVIDVTVTGAASDTVDELGDDAVVALNAVAAIAGAAYDSGTNVLTIAETTDGLGDLTVLAELYPPDDGTYGNPDVAIPSFITTVVDGGASGDALSCVLVASAVPTITAAVRVK